MRTVLSIAGSDSCGGAGIQADIKTITMNGVYAMSAITALTAQNTTGVRDVLQVSPRFLGEQLDAVFEDIPPDAVKIGMTGSEELIKVIAERLSRFGARNIVVDPVMVSTAGSRLTRESALPAMVGELFPLSTLITPNLPEAEALAGEEIRSAEDMESVAERLSKEYRCAVLLKGGHRVEDANDLLYYRGIFRWFRGDRVENPNTHGTGCTLSSAIAANLAKGFDLETSVLRAKEFITGALKRGLDLGKGSGPLDHTFCLSGYFSEHA